MDLRPGQQVDINTLLSLVEDIIRLQNQAAGDFYTDDIKKDHSKILSLHSVNLQGSQHDVLDFWFLSPSWIGHIILVVFFDNVGVDNCNNK